MHEKTSFGAWLQRRRRALDLTQQELSYRIGCSTAMLRKIEYGQRRPSKELAARLALYLDIPPARHGLFIHAARLNQGFNALTLSEGHSTAQLLTLTMASEC